MEFATLLIKDIFYDEEFNCRGEIELDSVADLADSIKRHGQDTSIVVQPIEDVRYDGNVPWRPDHKWRIVCGHRRYLAISEVLHLPEIKCEIVRGLTDQEARDRNLRENLLRKDLTMMQEARWLTHRYPFGIPIKAACQSLNKPEHWIRARKFLLEMDEKIQLAAEAGLLSQSNILALAQVKKSEQVQVANELVRIKGLNKRRSFPLTGIIPFYRRRNAAKRVGEIAKMMKWMMDNELEGLPVRMGAWCAGYTDDDAFRAECLQEISRNVKS